MPQDEFVASRRAGIMDVAARAGVSRQTVTRAMNDMPDISEETKQRVLAAARELHYRPSRFGRGLVTRTSPTMGLVVVDLRNSFWAELASHVLDAASQKGWRVLIAETAHGGRAGVENLADQVDPIVGHLELSDEEIETSFGPIPVVLYEREWTPASRALVEVDLRDAVAQLIDHLRSRRRRRLAMLDWSLSERESERAAQFRHAVARYDEEPRVLLTHTDADPDLDVAGNAAEKAMELWPDTDALVCFNDVVAVGVIKRLTALGIGVPERVAVAGIDGLQLGQVVIPELTTLQLDFDEIAGYIVDLVDRIASGKAPLRGADVRRRVSPALQVRQST